jgi:Na+/H+ antiporter NhaD/arsenite permease-like protein
MGDSIEHALVEVESEIFEIIMFLFPAMILVELLLQMGFFTLLQSFLQKRGYRDRKQFRILSFLTFFLSAVLDNLTTTLVMINMVNQSFKDRNRHIAGAGTVANANAGGAWSPIGDVTTIMLWLAGKFTAVQVVLIGFLRRCATASW